MADRVLQITDGTTTADFDGANNFHLRWDGWAPAVARRRLALLGGVGPYADVEETMIISIEDTSVDNIVGHLATLTELIDQAERWSLGENVDPVVIKYRPQDSSQTSALQAVIVGGPADGRILDYQPDFDAVDKSLYLNNITLRFRRRGLWLEASETESSSATTQPAVATTSNFAASHTIKSPLTISAIINASSGTFDASTTYSDTYIAVANGSNKLVVINAKDLNGTNYVTTGAVASSGAGNLLRFTPASTSYETTTTKKSLSGLLNSETRRFAVYMNMLSSSASVSWMIKAVLQLSGVTSESRPFIYTPSDTNPKWCYIGTLYRPVVDGLSDAGSLGLSIKPSTVSGAPNLDMDTLALVDLDDGVVVYFPSNRVGGTATAPAVTFTLDHQILDKPDATADIRVSASALPTTYRGNPAIFLNGQAVSGLYMATGDNTDPTTWRHYESSTTNPARMTLTAVRKAGYLVPQ